MKRIALAIAFTGLFYSIIASQDKLQAQGKSESTIELSYYKKADMTRTAVAIVKVRKDTKFVPAKNTQVNFYVMHDKQQQLLKSAYTDNKGKAVIGLQKDLPLDDDLFFTIAAKIENDKVCEDAEEKIHYKDVNLSLNLNPQDTLRLVIANVTETGKDGKESPVKDAEVKFYVLRMFGLMPAAEDNAVKTDEKGEASMAYPKNIPGNSTGLITVVARMEDNDRFGNVEIKANVTWGTLLGAEKDPFPRALWEPHAPLTLIITIGVVFGGVWSTYFFIFFQLRKIKKDEDLATNS